MMPYTYEKDIHHHISTCINQYKENNISVETPQILEILLTFNNSNLLRAFNCFRVKNTKYQRFGNYLHSFCARHSADKMRGGVNGNQFQSGYDFFNVKTNGFLVEADKIRMEEGAGEIEEKHISYAVLGLKNSATINQLNMTGAALEKLRWLVLHPYTGNVESLEPML